MTTDEKRKWKGRMQYVSAAQRLSDFRCEHSNHRLSADIVEGHLHIECKTCNEAISLPLTVRLYEIV